VNWLKKAKDAFARLKGRAVKHAEVKEWGINIVNKLFKAIGIDKRVGCPPRQVKDTLFVSPVLRLELRVPFCDNKDIDRMWEAVSIVAKEAWDLTPVDTGRLRESQRSNVTMEGRDTVLGTVEYQILDVFRATTSGNITFYALAVHNRWAYHGQDEYPNNGPRATWRFLEFAWENNRYIQNKVRGLFE
jgi:hypothetical protein